jgi:hypothetical protein
MNFFSIIKKFCENFAPTPQSEETAIFCCIVIELDTALLITAIAPFLPNPQGFLLALCFGWTIHHSSLWKMGDG